VTRVPSRVDVLCSGCGATAAGGEVGDVVQAGEAEDVAFLVAPRIDEAAPDELPRSQRLSCEGCGVAIYVAPSSQWLLDLKARADARRANLGET
jgi:hypothetical protein